MDIITLPKTIQDAIQAMIYLAKNKKSSVNIISIKCNISKTYLAKIMQKLSSCNLVKTSTGRYGGIELNIDPEDIRITDIIEALRGENKKEMCIIGIDECNDKTHCPIHPTWKLIKANIYKEFSNENLKSLSIALDKKIKQKK